MHYIKMLHERKAVLIEEKEIPISYAKSKETHRKFMEFVRGQAVR